MEVPKVTDDKILDLYCGTHLEQLSLLNLTNNMENIVVSIAYRIWVATKRLLKNVNETWLNAWHAIPPQRPGKLSLFQVITRNPTW